MNICSRRYKQMAFSGPFSRCSQQLSSALSSVYISNNMGPVQTAPLGIINRRYFLDIKY